MSLELNELYRVNEPRSDITFQLVRYNDDVNEALFEIANRHGSKLVTAHKFTFEIMALHTFEEFVAAIDREISDQEVAP